MSTITVAMGHASEPTMLEINCFQSHGPLFPRTND
jgi:hypothetical protein